MTTNQLLTRISISTQRGFFLPSPMMLLGGAAVVMGITTVMFWKLYNGAVNDYAEFKANVAAAQEQIRIENERKLKEMAEVNKQATDGWAFALDQLKRRGPIRVQPVRCPGTVSAVPAAATGTHDAAPQSGPSAEISITVEQCEQRVNNAVTDAAQVVHLQEWVRKQHEVTK